MPTPNERPRFTLAQKRRAVARLRELATQAEQRAAQNAKLSENRALSRHWASKFRLDADAFNAAADVLEWFQTNPRKVPP